MKKLLYLSIASLFTFVNTGFSQTDLAPKYSNEFLNIGVGARALGMSGAQTSTVNDVTAGYWNPAGLLSLENKFEVGVMHAEYFAGIAKYDFGAIAKRIDNKSSFGISYIRFGVDNIPNTTELIDAGGNIDYNKVTYFSTTDNALIFSYARNLGVKGLDLGANLKIIYRSVGDFGSSLGFGLDIGANYEFKKWKFSAVGKDVTSTFNAWSYTLDSLTKQTFIATGNEIPQNGLELTLPSITFGASRNIKINDKFGVLGVVDLYTTFDGKRNVLIKTNQISFDPRIGVEVDFKKMIFLRFGVANFQQVQNNTTFQPNIGIGVKIKNLSIDYALTDIGDQSVALYSNVFSLKLAINTPTK